ncbi:MAG: hypothetical protein PHT07_14485 [Paludibacter sp.]|nr:hypothetical protein [Paludibacter sp.]
MRKLILLTIITLFQLASYAQEKNREITKLFIAYKGDSTLFIEKYEIDVTEKQVYYITPIMNYLDVQGQKYRTERNINKKEWNDIMTLIYAIDLKKIESYNLAESDKIDYFAQITLNQSKTIEIKLSQEIMPVELRKIFRIIRNGK